MYNPEYFPTPPNVVALMKAAIREFGGGYHPILDPSAGAGALLEPFTGHYSQKPYAVEIEPEMQMVLSGKGYKVIGTDWLQFDEPVEFKTIVMNPPFSAGAKHFLKSWEHLAPGGVVCCLLNAETLRNPCDVNRQNVAEIIATHDGKVEYLGSAFKHSERPTDVEVAMVTVKKPKSQDFQFTVAGLEMDAIKDEELEPTAIAFRQPVKDLVSRYNAALAILKERHKSQQLLDQYLQGVEGCISSSSKQGEALEQNKSFLDQVLALKSRFWNTVFTKAELEKYAPSHIQKQFTEFTENQASMAFTEENINAILEMFFLNRGQIMEEAMCKVWDTATSYHKKNFIHHEGWKTNKAGKLNKKIIYPFGITHDDMGFHHCSWGHKTAFYEDLDKVLCWLSGKNIESIKTIMDALRGYRHDGERESEFFTIKLFKKGTVHLAFKDLKLLDDFNLAVARSRKWIASDY